MRFRPCIDLHDGKVKQIVGGTLAGPAGEGPRTNFETDAPPADFAARYRADGLHGGHVIMLGPGNEDAARRALAAFPGGFHAGGGIRPDNAGSFLDAGASHVIVTSFVFREGRIDDARLTEMVRAVGRHRLVLDLSCRRRDGVYRVVTDRWQCFTAVEVNGESLERLAASCDEFLVHAVDVEGLRLGVDERLIALLAAHAPIPTTYAGGVRSLADLQKVKDAGGDMIDVTVGSALDLFGGALRYEDVVAFCRQ